MGNYITHNTTTTPSSTKAATKVILPNGAVHSFDNPLTVAELMFEYPQQVVVEFNPKLTEKRPTPLPADKKLDANKVYIMLPVKRGGRIPSLSSNEARHVLSSANSVLHSKSVSAFRLLPLFASVFCGPVAIDNSMEREKQVAFKYEMEKESKDYVAVGTELMLPEEVESRPEFLCRQVSGKGTWKPSLDTIKEKKVENKVPHWLF